MSKYMEANIHKQIPEFHLSSWDHNVKWMTVYILKPKPDHDQLVFANYFYHAWHSGSVGSTILGQLRLEQVSLRSQKSFCDCLNSLGDIALPCMVNLTLLVNQAD